MTPSFKRIFEEISHDLIGIVDISTMPVLLTRHVNQIGFGQMSMGTGCPTAPSPKKTVEIFFNTYSEEWFRHYNNKGYVRRDPVVRRLLDGSQRGFEWTQETLGLKYNRHATTFMDEAKQHGVVTGFSLSRGSPDGAVTSMSFASKDTFRVAPEEAALLDAIGGHMLTTASKIIARRNKFGLTDREARILLWIAEGETDKQIAERLSIRQNMVSRYAASTIAKLNAVNRTHAIATAVRAKII